jgi:hypothetical protein
MRDPSPSKAARRRARDRRYRARKSRCAAVAPVEFDSGVVDFLIATHWLDEREAEDRHAIGAAISAALRDAMRRR